MAALAVALGVATVSPAAALDAAEALRRAVEAVCARGSDDAGALAAALGWTAADVAAGEGSRHAPRRVLLAPDGDEIQLRALARAGRVLRIDAEFHAKAEAGEARPTMMAIADGECRIMAGRRIDYGAEGRPETLVVLDRELASTGFSEPLDAPVPPGRDPGGVAVALVDSGVNYTLPALARRLARDSGGRALGYDFWDMDARPFDLNVAASPFFPTRHGTRVASILVREAPKARLVPYRYPRPDMARMAALIADAEAKGAVVVALAMGSNDRADWAAYEAAARARPDMLFVVSAGNNGRDIDAEPVYPAALALPNQIVVTSCDAAGRLGPGSNWGARAVDVMVPGEELPVLDHLGRPGTASGTSYAVPRVAALAARLLAANPAWRAGELKRAIVARAEPSPYHREPIVRHGWIARPDRDE